MKKKCGFLAKVRLCLCLISCCWIASYSVLKPGNSAKAEPESYLLTVVLLDQDSQGELMSRLAAMDMQPQMAYKDGVEIWTGPPQKMTIKIKIQDEEQLKRVDSNLSAIGVHIQSLVRENN